MTSRALDLGQLGRILGFVSALPLALIVVLTFSDVFARYLFSHPITGASEIIQFAMAMAIFTALPLVTNAGGHVTVDIFIYALSSRNKVLLQLPSELLSGLALAVIAWRLWIQAAEYTQNHTATIVLGLPMAPLAYAMAVFSAVSVVIVGLRFVATLQIVFARPEVTE